MKIRQNLHIHSAHSCDSACATLADIQKEMLKYGMTEFGISDHFHSQYNLCDIAGARNDFLAYERPPQFHFGVEVSCMSKWECQRIAEGRYERIIDDPVYGLRYQKIDEDADLSPCIDLTKEDIERLKIEYVIGGVHWPSNSELDHDALIEDIYQQHLYLASEPLVDIIAHPWDCLEIMCVWKDWCGLTGKGRFNRAVADNSVFNHLKEKNEKLLERILKNNKLVELNLAVLSGPQDPSVLKAMWTFLAEWREAGAKFVIGSDQHSAHANPELYRAMEQLLDCYGFKDEHIHYLFADKN